MADEDEETKGLGEEAVRSHFGQVQYAKPASQRILSRLFRVVEPSTTAKEH